MSKTAKLERKIIRRAQQIACEARGNIPVGRDYLTIPSWSAWREQAWQEIVIIYARKNRAKINRMIVRSL